ncbi:MAG: 50S ribosomal protein L29 [Candidatus Diapherotrites archaeon]|uniref:Large ribosomal subunit protein uL29 n=1 Tax=Candidatus Iainarchaeum sp. TaxID=3101447 RepID=A0A7K4BYD6_9ARCH|nr:50S ribosomal protein L29 [Candidatus Diapherotrites archaeon]
MKAKEIQKMSVEEITQKLVEAKQELARERATLVSGTKSENSGKIRKLKRDIARMFTVLNQKEVKA